MAFEKIQVAKGDTGYLLSGDVHVMLHAHPVRRRMWHCDRHLTTVMCMQCCMHTQRAAVCGTVTDTSRR